MPLDHHEQRNEQLHRLLHKVGQELRSIHDPAAQQEQIRLTLERLEASVLELQHLLGNANPPE